MTPPRIWGGRENPSPWDEIHCHSPAEASLKWMETVQQRSFPAPAHSNGACAGELPGGLCLILISGCHVDFLPLASNCLGLSLVGIEVSPLPISARVQTYVRVHLMIWKPWPEPRCLRWQQCALHKLRSTLIFVFILGFHHPDTKDCLSEAEPSSVAPWERLLLTPSLGHHEDKQDKGLQKQIC